ncbi:MAG: hypothetical protein QOH47_491 [Sphingomonadales bacterium]|nr:hypothetical protein [Sphingomonadales bacterium]
MAKKVGTVPVFPDLGRGWDGGVEKNRDCPYFLPAAQGK